MSDVIQGADAPPMPAPLESPEPVVKSYAEELEAAAADLAPSKPQNGVTLKKGKKEEEPEPAPAPPAAKEPVTQEKLSSGFAKLERQRKAVAKKEAELASKEAEITRLREELDKSHTERSSAVDARAGDVDKLLKLFDEDEEACLEALASRRKTTVESFYDKLTRRRLNGGVRAPEDQVAEVRAEVDALKKEKAADAAEREATAEKARKEKEDEIARQAFAERIQKEDAGFVQYCKSNDGDKLRYPLLSEEPAEDIIQYARSLIAGATAQGKNVGYTEVADYIEHLLRLKNLEDEAAAKAKAEAETPKKSAPEAKGKKAEPAKAKTITNSMSTPRVLKSEGTPLTEEERHERALAMWK